MVRTVRGLSVYVVFDTGDVLTGSEFIRRLTVRESVDVLSGDRRLLRAADGHVGRSPGQTDAFARATAARSVAPTGTSNGTVVARFERSPFACVPSVTTAHSLTSSARRVL